MLLIGSRAARLQIASFRRPKDWDLVCTLAEAESFLKFNKEKIRGQSLRELDGKPHKFKVKMKETSFELEIAEPLGEKSSDIMLFMDSILHWRKVKTKYGNFSVAPLLLLMAIKESHIQFPIHWFKNIEDYHTLKHWTTKHFDIGKIIAYDKFVGLRRDEIRGRERVRNPNLNMTNSEFFQKSSKVGRIFAHDDLHLSTCFYGRPLYERCKLDLNKAALNKELFEKLCLEDKVRMVQEECFAIALERKIIPQIVDIIGKDKCPPIDSFFLELLDTIADSAIEQAFVYAQMRVSTTLTGGWFRDFALENYEKIKLYPRTTNFVALFLSSLKEGKIHAI